MYSLQVNFKIYLPYSGHPFHLLRFNSLLNIYFL